MDLLVSFPPLVHFEDAPIPWGESSGGNIASLVQHLCCVSFYAFFVVPTFLYKMPPYPGVSQVMEIEKVDDWQVQYAQYLAEKESKELAVCEVGTQQQTLRTAAEAEDWASEYYKYLSEKESRQAQKEGGSEA